MESSSKRIWVLMAAVAVGFVAVGIRSRFGTASPEPATIVAASHKEEGSPWLTDMQPALRAARASGKDILILFVAPEAGDPAAFDAAPFCAAAASCVLVRLTSSAQAAPESATQTATWGERLNVKTFPTLALLDSHGRPCSSEPCPPDDVPAAVRVVERLERTRSDRDSALAAAARATGAERARLLDRALSAVRAGPTDYLDVMQQIAAADPGNASGVLGKYEPLIAAGTIERAIQNEVYPLIDGGNLPAAIARLDQLGRDARPAIGDLQLLLAFQGQLYFSLGDRQKALALLDRAIALAPDSGPASKVRAARAQVAGGT